MTLTTAVIDHEVKRDGHSLPETTHGWAELVLSGALSDVASAYYGSGHEWQSPIYGSV